MELSELFKGIPDYRQRGMCEFVLSDIFILSLFACLSGANDSQEIVAYGRHKLDFLRTLSSTLTKIPSHDTVERVFQNIDTTKFSSILYRCSQLIFEYEGKYNLNLDGKVLRGTAQKRSKDGKKARKNDGICILTAWASEQRVVLGQQKVGAKTNEKTAIPELIDTMNIKDAIVTIDAVLCTPKVAAQIVDKRGDYILSVKGGNKLLLEQLTDWFARPNVASFEEAHHTDYVGGRIEQRHCTLTHNLEVLDETHAYKNCRSVIRIVSTREYNKGTELRKETETRYYISSLDHTPTQFNTNIRGHWGIENNLHWALDVVLNEDACRVRKGNAPENLNTLRKIVLQILQNVSDKRSLKIRRKTAGWDDEYALNMVLSFLQNNQT
jgi:predicted transposase YbfD/YdcC